MHSMGVEADSFVDRHVDAVINMIIFGSTSQEVGFLQNSIATVKT